MKTLIIISTLFLLTLGINSCKKEDSQKIMVAGKVLSSQQFYCYSCISPQGTKFYIKGDWYNNNDVFSGELNIGDSICWLNPTTGRGIVHFITDDNGAWGQGYQLTLDPANVDSTIKQEIPWAMNGPTPKTLILADSIIMYNN